MIILNAIVLGFIPYSLVDFLCTFRETFCRHLGGRNEHGNSALLRDIADRQLLSGSGILKLAGWGSVGDEQQKGEAVFGAGVCFMVDDVNILGGSVHSVNKNAETLVAATKEIGLEVNADKTKYMIMSQDQNTGRGHSMKIDNSPIERVEEFKYLGTTLTNQNSMQEEIKSRLKLGNACYYSVQNLLSSRLLSKNVKIKIHRTTICPLSCMGVKIGR